ncbi:MAG: glycosyltransferase [Ignavibacteria bacterium]|nr:glycosyltransferase [Ignavibacteria bacterium]
MIDQILLILLALYLMKILLFWSGSRRASKPQAFDSEPVVTVIVAARNEETNIDACVDGLSRIEYPPKMLEIIVVDDQSTDSTPELLRAWEGRCAGLRVLRTTGSLYDLHGKANAVAQAVEQSRGEIILTTDADCVVSPAWVRNTVRQYAPDTGCVCGFTLIRGKGGFNGMQALDWVYLLTIASAGVGWGFPLSAVGNNMSFRRKAYDDVDGYRGVGFSVTEDFALFKAISYKTKWKIRYPVEPSTVVWSEPCADLHEVYRQKKRWGRGGVDIHPVGFGIMSIGWLMNIALFVVPFLGVSPLVWIAALAGKFAGDAFLLSRPLTIFGIRHLYRYFLHYELYYLVYVTLLPFIVFLTGKVVWKDRKL